jgi:hypothetical protein
MRCQNAYVDDSLSKYAASLKYRGSTLVDASARASVVPDSELHAYVSLANSDNVVGRSDARLKHRKSVPPLPENQALDDGFGVDSGASVADDDTAEGVGAVVEAGIGTGNERG